MSKYIIPRISEIIAFGLQFDNVNVQYKNTLYTGICLVYLFNSLL